MDQNQEKDQKRVQVTDMDMEFADLDMVGIWRLVRLLSFRFEPGRELL
jgi:hypothetical protein